jgi:hypothetical protein
MKSIFIVTYSDNIVSGHGESSNITRLATYDGWSEKQYPAFKTHEDAQKFIDKVCKWYKPQITELPIYDETQAD